MGNKGAASGGQGGGYMQMQMMENGGEVSKQGSFDCVSFRTS